MSQCKFCDKEIMWGMRPDGKSFPLENDSFTAFLADGEGKLGAATTKVKPVQVRKAHNCHGLPLGGTSGFNVSK